MTEGIIIAIVAGCFSTLGTIIVQANTKRKRDIENAVRDAKLDMQLDDIIKRLDIHNGYAEKFGDIEKSVVEICTEIKQLKEFHK